MKRVEGEWKGEWDEQKNERGCGWKGEEEAVGSGRSSLQFFPSCAASVIPGPVPSPTSLPFPSYSHLTLHTYDTPQLAPCSMSTLVSISYLVLWLNQSCHHLIRPLPTARQPSSSQMDDPRSVLTAS